MNAKIIEVFFESGINKSMLIGRLAMRGSRIYFEWDASFKQQDIHLAPLTLSRNVGVVEAPLNLNEGLHSLFAESLPDAWGRLLTDRTIRAKGGQPEHLTPLDRLVLLGANGGGALTYHPSQTSSTSRQDFTLDQLARDALLLIENEQLSADSLDRLRGLGASSGGARPKVQLSMDAMGNLIAPDLKEAPWIVKFNASHDLKSGGAVEYIYSMLARRVGIEMAKTSLFASKDGAGWFGTERFDRFQVNDGWYGRTHFLSLAGLLDIDFTLPSIGYDGYLKATHALTRDMQAVEQAFHRMVFNVILVNRDDHAKNVGFLMNEKGQWRLAPAYDLTFNIGAGGEHMMDIKGEGRHPTRVHVLQIAKEAGIDVGRASDIISEVMDATSDLQNLLKEHGVSLDEINIIIPYVEKMRIAMK